MSTTIFTSWRNTFPLLIYSLFPADFFRLRQNLPALEIASIILALFFRPRLSMCVRVCVRILIYVQKYL